MVIEFSFRKILRWQQPTLPPGRSWLSIQERVRILAHDPFTEKIFFLSDPTTEFWTSWTEAWCNQTRSLWSKCVFLQMQTNITAETNTRSYFYFWFSRCSRCAVQFDSVGDYRLPPEQQFHPQSLKTQQLSTKLEYSDAGPILQCGMTHHSRVTHRYSFWIYIVFTDINLVDITIVSPLPSSSLLWNQNRIYFCPDCGLKKVGAKEIVNHCRCKLTTKIHLKSTSTSVLKPVEK